MKHICYFEVPADNLERARHFYNKLFGWEFSEMSMGHAPYFTIKTPDGISGGEFVYRARDDAGLQTVTKGFKHTQRSVPE